MTLKKKICLSVFIVVGFFCGGAKESLAQVKATGEIVNINYDYKIAFTDLLKGQVELGEVVEVYEGDKFIANLEVVESTSVITKLSPSRFFSGPTPELDFKRIIVGNKVKAFKQGKSLHSGGPVISRFSDLETKSANLAQEIEKKNLEISSLNRKKDILEKKNQDLQQKILQLKQQLESIGNALDEKIISSGP